MSKKDYIDAVNEIEIDENIKIKTLKKMKTNKTKYNKIYPIASLSIMCAIIITIFVPSMLQKTNINEIGYEKVQETNVLPKVENFKNLHAMLKDRSKDTNKVFWFTSDDIAMEEIKVEDSTVSTNQSTDSLKNEYSETNTQVEGVDEADIVKTDGKYIYYLARDVLTIINSQNSNNLVLSSKIEFESEDYYPQEIFLRENKVIIIGTETRKKENKESNSLYSSYEIYTAAKVYNVENKEKPILERTVEVEGTYISSRMIDDNIYLITNKSINAYLCKKYSEKRLDENEFKPKYSDSIIGKEIKTVSFDSIYYIPEFEDTSYLNIATFNIKEENPVNIQSYLGAGDEIYASTTNLYITKVKYNYTDNELKTEIYKFSLDEATCTFQTTGSVPGSVLNQFSMDEKDGYFRIATTDNNLRNSEDNTNNLYVLNENLEIVGKIEGLAKGEKIYSVRFMGNRAYMVTFVETDPLFVIDLSQPTNPKVLGELKIPGYSKYLHPYDETHLIGFGEDTKIVNYGYGDIVTTDGMKMSLFDVTDPSNPTEMYTVKIGKEGTYSELLYNHKALLFSKEKNLIAFPISITGDNYNVIFKGAIIYELTLEKGFELKGKISNTATALEEYYKRYDIERIIYIKDTFYTLSYSLIKATDIETMQTKSILEIK